MCNEVQHKSMATQALQSMDLTSLKAVVSELRQSIIPSRFELAQQSNSHTIQISLRTLKGIIWLELCWHAASARLVEIDKPTHIGSKSTLAKQLQYSLGKMALIEIKQEGFERIVEFGLANRPGEVIQRFLVIEIMGRHSNLLLLDQKRRVIAIGKQIRNHHSRVRPIGTGDLYVSPPSINGIPPKISEPYERWKERLCLIPKSLREALQECYQGISPSLATQLVYNNKLVSNSLLALSVENIPEEEWKRIHQNWLSWLNQLDTNNFHLKFTGPSDYTVWGIENKPTDSNANISLQLGRYYRNKLEEKNLQEKLEELQKRLIKFKNSESSILKGQEQSLLDAKHNDLLQKQADTLLAKANPSKDNIREAQNLYRKAKKQRRSISLIEERIKIHQERIDIINCTETFLNHTITDQWANKDQKLTHINELSEELDVFLNSKKKNNVPYKKIKRKTHSALELKSPGGLKIQVGRNHRQNELISIRQARSGDIWFHAQECPGSHVVLKASAGIPQEGDLEMAADLAAFYSRAKANKSVPIVMASTDELQRIPGSISGTISFRKFKVCWGHPEKINKDLFQQISK